jgi:hypothetical protein
MTTPRSRHLVSTTPRRATCPRCRRTVLDGIDFGTPYRVDAIPLTLTGELAARLEERGTYRLQAERFVRREHLDIAADTERGRPAVCAAHSCAPVNPSHVDAQHVAAFIDLVVEKSPASPEKEHEQGALLVLTGAFAGAQVLTIPVDTDTPPF